MATGSSTSITFQCRTIFSVVIILSAVMTSRSYGAAADDGRVPTVDPHRLTVEVGSESSRTECSFQESIDTVVYRWFFNGDELGQSPESRKFYNESTGVLTINDSQLNDTGDYTCAVVNYPLNCSLTSCVNTTFAFKVYVMPDYTTDGIIIGVINGVLLVVFIGSLIRSAILDRRRLKKYGQMM